MNTLGAVRLGDAAWPFSGDVVEGLSRVFSTVRCCPQILLQNIQNSMLRSRRFAFTLSPV